MIRLSSIGKAASLVTLGVCGVFAAPQTAAAQRNQNQNLERVLILTPIPVDPTDTAYVFEMADEMRKRLNSRAGRDVRVIDTEQVCEALAASGFDCTALLDPTAGEQLAQFLRADAYVVSWLNRNSAPALRMRIVDIGRSGIAGWVVVPGVAGQTAEDLAKIAGDSLRNQVRVGEQARECSDRRDRSDFDGARNRAERAFRDYPNHPSAAQCLAYLFEATQQPPDSVILAYQKVVAGDSLNDRAWDRLSLLYLQRGDTLEAVMAKQSQLAATPHDAQLRAALVAMWIELDDYDAAIAVAEDGLKRSPGDPAFLQLKTRACSEGEMWPCALEALAELYEVDRNLVGDTVFYAQIIGAATLGGDLSATLRWTREAITEVPTSTAFWRAHAQALKDAGQTAAAVAAYARVSELDPDDIRAPLAAAQTLTEALVIDTTVPLDTASMRLADSLLTSVAERTQDQNVLQNISVQYFTPASTIARAQYMPSVSVSWLEKALMYDVGNRLQTQANFFLGFASFFYLQELFEPVRDSESCEMVDEYDRVVTRAIQAMNLGRSISEATATQLLSGLQQFADLTPRFREAFQC